MAELEKVKDNETLITELKEEVSGESMEPVKRKEYEKLLFEDTKRKETEKALTEVKLGLFEQKEVITLDFSKYTLMTYGKKFKGLYDLYQDNETLELLYVCPLIENNKGDEHERKDLKPYAYDVLFLEFLDEEAYTLVRQAAVHEKSKLIDVFYYSAIVFYFVLLLLNVSTIVYCVIMGTEFIQFLFICGSLWAGQAIFTALLPILLMQYRRFKAL